MIQIQDNSQPSNDPVFTPEPVVKAAPAPAPAVAPTPVSIPDPVPTPVEPVKQEGNPIQGLVGDVKASESVAEATAPTQASEAEIDDLLSQLEKLSKEIEDKADSGVETKTSKPVAEEKTGSLLG
jgi:ABC-type transporter Mla subunit MlaD